MFAALKSTIGEELSPSKIRANVLSGITVGVIALPLSMALAIAIGVPPQHGLYTAIVAGIVIGLAGGSRVNISGPTAAFVVILLPITQEHGLGGLLISGFLAGLILIGLGVARLGNLIKVVPYPVTIGFTAGIGTVIASLQVKDFFGLNITSLDGNFLKTLEKIVLSFPTIRWEDTFVGAITLLTLLVWPKLKTRLPQHLVALIVGSFVAWLLVQTNSNFEVSTIGSRFSFEHNGIVGHGIPPFLPSITWPWLLPDGSGKPIGISLELIKLLIGPAFAIAILGALESLLCAVVADGMSGSKHDPNDELIGQGIGNLIIPFFGGITATAALARTAANIRTGGSSPISSVVHSLFILFSLVSLAPLLSYIPMASLAALLFVVAWNMSEVKHFTHILKKAPTEDIITLLTCYLLTVFIDMEIAVSVGMGLAGALFIKRSMDLTGSQILEAHNHPHLSGLPDSVIIYDIDGPLFFGSAQKALSEVTRIRNDIQVVILDLTDVTMLDMTGIVAIESIIANLKSRNILLLINGLLPRIINKLKKAGIIEDKGKIEFTSSMEEIFHRSIKALKIEACILPKND